VVRPSASRVDEATRYAGDEELVLDLEFDDVVEFLLPVREHRVEPLGLGNGTRESIKDETTIEYKTVSGEVFWLWHFSRSREPKVSTPRRNDPI